MDVLEQGMVDLFGTIMRKTIATLKGGKVRT